MIVMNIYGSREKMKELGEKMKKIFVFILFSALFLCLVACSKNNEKRNEVDDDQSLVYFCDNGDILDGIVCIKNVDDSYDDSNNIKDYKCDFAIYDLSDDKKECIINENKLKSVSKKPSIEDDYICHAGASYYGDDNKYCNSSTDSNKIYPAASIKKYICENNYTLRTLDYEYNIDNPNLKDLPDHAERVCVKDEYKDYHNITNSIKICKNGYRLKNGKCIESYDAKLGLSSENNSDIKQENVDSEEIEKIIIMGSFSTLYSKNIVDEYTGTFTFKNGKLTDINYITNTQSNLKSLALKSINTRLNNSNFDYKWDVGFLRVTDKFYSKDYISYEINIKDVDKMSTEQRKNLSSSYLSSIGGKSDYLIEDWNKLYDAGVDPNLINSKIEHIKLIDRDIDSFYKFVKENQGYYKELLIVRGKISDLGNSIVFDGKSEYSIKDYDIRLKELLKID